MSITVPKLKTGAAFDFESHGKRFTLKRLARDVYCLSCPLHTGRVRFADTYREIVQDVSHCIDYGVLPGTAGHP